MHQPTDVRLSDINKAIAISTQYIRSSTSQNDSDLISCLGVREQKTEATSNSNGKPASLSDFLETAEDIEAFLAMDSAQMIRQDFRKRAIVCSVNAIRFQ
jgi:hypothetical protein